MRFREGSREDRAAILALHARCFGATGEEKQSEAFWNWEFARARITVGEAGQSIQTHIALLDLPHMIRGQKVRGALAVDAMTAPEARGKGAFTQLVQHALTTSDHVVATAYQIRSAVLGPMLHAGWSVGARIPVLLRPAIGILSPPQLARLERSDAEWMSTLGARDGCVARTPEFIQWRFFDNPVWRYACIGMRNEGYLVMRRTVLKGLDTMAIVDAAARDGRTLRVLIRTATAHARNAGCTLVGALVSRAHPAFWNLIRCGFVPGPHAFRLLVHPRPEIAASWRVMWADTDHL